MSRLFSLFVVTTTLCLATACQDVPARLPNISGKAGEVGIVMDKPNWEGELGSSFRTTLAAEYPFLPQPEPIFTLFNVPHNAFSAIFQSHRNLIIVHISPDYAEGQMVIQENVWAAPQIVATFSGPNAAEIQACFDQQKQKLISAIEQAERNRVITSSKRHEEKSLRLLVNESFGGSPYFPVGYFLKKQEKNFIWITWETTYTTHGILVYTYPYTDSTSLSKPVMLQQCSAMMKSHVPGPLDNTWMIISPAVEPSLRWIHYNNNDFAELRGLWDVQNDFMGGPFVAHFYLDAINKRVLVFEAFVYAPRFDKRNYIRQIESILYSFEWATESEPV